MMRQQHINRAIGEHVASVLMEQGASKQGTARRAGIAPTTFRRCLTGERALFVSELWRVSQALDLNVGALLPPTATLNAAVDRQRAEYLDDSEWPEG